MIIDEGQIYKIELEADIVDKIYLNKVSHPFEGDTFFTKLNSDWEEVTKVKNKADKKHKYNYDFITIERN